MIEGVVITPVVSHDDERQTFREIFKTDRLRQVSHCNMRRGVQKLGHYHKKQTDWWYVAAGGLILHLEDIRFESKTFGQTMRVLIGGEFNELSVVVEIPPMVAHGCTVTDGPCHLIYGTDREYDPEDEFRIG